MSRFLLQSSCLREDGEWQFCSKIESWSGLNQGSVMIGTDFPVHLCTVLIVLHNSFWPVLLLRDTTSDWRSKDLDTTGSKWSCSFRSWIPLRVFTSLFMPTCIRFFSWHDWNIPYKFSTFSTCRNNDTKSTELRSFLHKSSICQSATSSRSPEVGAKICNHFQVELVLTIFNFRNQSIFTSLVYRVFSFCWSSWTTCLSSYSGTQHRSLGTW
jgi:hypothetical protein